jgi:spermidine synthase
MTSSLNRLLVWVLFFFSGASGLIYEVLWCRHLGLLFGNTAHSLSTVLVAFMGGLALGSFIAGRNAERVRRPFLAYGVLEVIIGLYCAVLPFFFSIDSPLVGFYRSLYGESGSTTLIVVRLLVSLGLLLVPTICMGATLPLLTQYLVKSKSVLGRTAGSLYAVNSLGAALGALSAGFILMPLLGKTGANTLAVVLNLALGVIAIVLGRSTTSASERATEEPVQASEPTQTAVEQAPISPQALRATIFCFGITGFAAMATQIGWTKAISLGTGSSTYAFSLIVSVFILGLSSGGAWASRLAARVHDPLALLGRILLLTACFNMTIAVLLGYSPILFFLGLALGAPHGWNAVLASQALCIGLIIFAPTFLMGASMPLTLQVAARGSAGAARITGNVYSVNTLGSIIGSALGGLLLIPFLAVQLTLELMAGFYLVTGLVLFFLSESRKNKTDAVRNCILGGVTVIVALVGGRWDAGLMSSGLYLKRP